MDVIEFVSRYPAYLAQPGKVVKPEYQPIIRKMKKPDPHDMVKPGHYFHSEAETIGIVFKLFLKTINNSKQKP